MSRFKHWFNQPFNPVAILLGLIAAAYWIVREKITGKPHG